MPRCFPNEAATRRSISRTCFPMRSADGPPRSTDTTAAISSSPWTLPAYSMRMGAPLQLGRGSRSGSPMRRNASSIAPPKNRSRRAGGSSFSTSA